ncbi:hypothetical protein BM221_007433 [Beauveria bassiana]|uniref:Uncharacterized protein n=1 Tax=Beauveria bassiana TaxID=176275 RepID=A0A2N6NGS0_BEABA|nr:hypothetical protein BM221_007433 [Beauveria bassiana]
MTSLFVTRRWAEARQKPNPTVEHELPVGPAVFCQHIVHVLVRASLYKSQTVRRCQQMRIMYKAGAETTLPAKMRLAAKRHGGSPPPPNR